MLPTISRQLTNSAANRSWGTIRNATSLLLANTLLVFLSSPDYEDEQTEVFVGIGRHTWVEFLDMNETFGHPGTKYYDLILAWTPGFLSGINMEHYASGKPRIDAVELLVPRCPDGRCQWLVN